MHNSDVQALAAYWGRLAAELKAPRNATEAWRRRLFRAYSNPLRAYHTLAHLAFLKAEIDRHGALVRDPILVGLAIFFHDFIYRTWRRDNEKRSADAAATALAQLGGSADLTTRVSRLILWTTGHAPPPEADGDDLLFLDMDLAILGAAPEAYRRYARGVRREYFWVSPRRYRQGRRAFLQGMLARPRLFNTDRYEADIGARARRNMADEIATLGG